MKTVIFNKLTILLLALAFLATFNRAHAQGTTAFTYQGQLRDGGTNANGAYTMIFKLYDLASAGTQFGSTITTTATLANGLFTVNLDFGPVAFLGFPRWLDITITSGATTQTLSPRVRVLPTPYAIYATTAGFALSVADGTVGTAQIASNCVGTAQIATNSITAALIATNSITAALIATNQVVKNLNGLTDNVILSAGANMALFTNGNALQLSAVVPNIRLFASGGTFVVPTNVTRIMVEMWGGGGGGGNDAGPFPDNPNTPNLIYYGGGGGAGGFALGTFDVTPNSSIPVIVGTGGGAGQSGGTSSFGALMSAGGGSPGGNGADGVRGSGGVGGDADGGVITLEGGDGAHAAKNGAGGTVFRGGMGGWGQGNNGAGSSDAYGDPGGLPGGGGGGGGPGGSGAQGAVIVYY